MCNKWFASRNEKSAYQNILTESSFWKSSIFLHLSQKSIDLYFFQDFYFFDFLAMCFFIEGHQTKHWHIYFDLVCGNTNKEFY